MNPQTEVERIIEKRIEEGKVHYLVRWNQILSREDSWENEEKLCWAGRQIHLFERNEPSQQT